MGSITRNFANNILTDGKFDATDVVGNITSTGIDDNASGNAITIESSKRVQFTRARSNTLGDSALEILPSDTVAGIGFRMENTNNDLVIEKSSPSGSEAEILRIRIGGGIALGGTGDENTLDDYEEGTWSPALSGTTGGASGVNFGDRFGSYVKIGKSVTVQIYINLDSWSSGPSGNLVIGTLPFTSSSTSAFRSSVSIGYTANFSTAAPIGGQIGNSGTVIYLRKSNGTSALENMSTFVPAANASGDEEIMVTATYETD